MNKSTVSCGFVYIYYRNPLLHILWSEACIFQYSVHTEEYNDNKSPELLSFSRSEPEADLGLLQHPRWSAL